MARIKRAHAESWPSLHKCQIKHSSRRSEAAWGNEQHRQICLIRIDATGVFDPLHGGQMELDNLYGVQACSLTRMRIMLRQPSAKTGLFALGNWAWKERLTSRRAFSRPVSLGPRRIRIRIRLVRYGVCMGMVIATVAKVHNYAADGTAA